MNIKCYYHKETTEVLVTLYLLKEPKLKLRDEKSTVLIVGIGKAAECVAYSSPSPPVPYPRLPKWIKNSAYPEAEIRGSLGIIPSDFPGSSATVSCRAYFLIDGVRISVGVATASIQLSDALEEDLNYTNVGALSLGETVTCKEPSNVFVSGDAEWNGFELQDNQTVRVPDQIDVGPHLIGCEVREDYQWTRKIYNLPVIGLQEIECTVYGDAEHGIPETSEVFEINLLDYDPILVDDDIVLPPVPLLPLLMAWTLWFCILFFNALFVAYLLKQNSLYRITQMQVMNRKRTGGTRLNRRMENLPFVYIQRSELDGQLFRRLRLLIDLYSGFFEMGNKWLLLWTMNVSSKTSGRNQHYWIV
ncbi:hypothetical protein SprV_0602211100 [Sparganum proliferum]